MRQIPGGVAFAKRAEVRGVEVEGLLPQALRRNRAAQGDFFRCGGELHVEGALLLEFD